jgi:hypothetical protein
MSWEILSGFFFCALQSSTIQLEQRFISSNFSRSQVIEIENTKT